MYIYIYIVFKSNTPPPNAEVFFSKINIKTHLLLVIDSDFSFLCSHCQSFFFTTNETMRVKLPSNQNQDLAMVSCLQQRNGVKLVNKQD